MPTVAQLIEIQQALKPCPRCGAQPELTITDGIIIPEGLWYACCSNYGNEPNYNGCGSEIWTEPNRSLKETIKLWNEEKFAIVLKQGEQYLPQHDRKRNYHPNYDPLDFSFKNR